MAFADELKTAAAKIQTAHDADVAKLQAFVDRTGILLPYDWSSYNGTALNLTGYVETFRDDFTDPATVMGDTGTGGKWYSPVHSDFGGATFKRDAITVANGQCRIRCERTSPPSATSDWGVWKTGHMQTMNKAGQGFSQSMGYFEARMKFPKQLVPYGWIAKTGAPKVPQIPADSHGARGAWPSFWLLSDNEYQPFWNTNHLIEMDAMECYGSDPAIHSAVHLKPRRVPQPNDPPARQSNSEIVNKNWVMWDGNFHDYGALYDDTYLTIFFDGKSVARYNMNDYLRIPMYMNISLALFKDHMWAAASPMDLTIDYVRAMRKA